MMLLGGVATLLLIGLFGVVVVGLLTGAGWEAQLGGGPEDERPRLKERWSYGSGTVKAVRIPLEGIILRERRSGFLAPQYDRVESVLRQIRAAAADKAVRGILLEVESPGGVVGACDEIRNALLEFRKGGDRQVVVWIRGMAASGAYYISVAGDWIVAQPASLVGSIGVLLSALNWSALSEKIGITNVTIKSARYKDLLNPFREVEPEERQIVQRVVDSAHQMFMAAVAEGRGLEQSEVAALADGRIFVAEEAVRLGLVDEVGYWSTAYRRLRERIGVQRLKLIRYEGSAGVLQFLASAARGMAPWGWEGFMMEPRLMYLWSP